MPESSNMRQGSPQNPHGELSLDQSHVSPPSEERKKDVTFAPAASSFGFFGLMAIDTSSGSKAPTGRSLGSLTRTFTNGCARSISGAITVKKARNNAHARRIYSLKHGSFTFV